MSNNDPPAPPADPQKDPAIPPIQTPLQKKIEALDPEIKKIMFDQSEKIDKLVAFQETIVEEKAATKLQQYNTDRTEKFEELIKLRPDLKEGLKEAHLDRINDILIGAKNTKQKLSSFGTPPNDDPPKDEIQYTHDRFKKFV